MGVCHSIPEFYTPWRPHLHLLACMPPRYGMPCRVTACPLLTVIDATNCRANLPTRRSAVVSTKRTPSVPYSLGTQRWLCLCCFHPLTCQQATQPPASLTPYVNGGCVYASPRLSTVLTAIQVASDAHFLPPVVQGNVLKPSPVRVARYVDKWALFSSLSPVAPGGTQYHLFPDTSNG